MSSGRHTQKRSPTLRCGGLKTELDVVADESDLVELGAHEGCDGIRLQRQSVVVHRPESTSAAEVASPSATVRQCQPWRGGNGPCRARTRPGDWSSYSVEGCSGGDAVPYSKGGRQAGSRGRVRDWRRQGGDDGAEEGQQHRREQEHDHEPRSPRCAMRGGAPFETPVVRRHPRFGPTRVGSITPRWTRTCRPGHSGPRTSTTSATTSTSSRIDAATNSRSRRSSLRWLRAYHPSIWMARARWSSGCEAKSSRSR